MITVPEGRKGSGAEKKVRTKSVVSSAQVRAAIVALEVGADSRVVNDTGEAPCPENAIAGIPLFAASQAAPLGIER